MISKKLSEKANIHEIHEKANIIVRRAGRLLESFMENPAMREAKVKADGSPVTPADLKLSEFLIKELEVFGYPIISEECIPKGPYPPGGSFFLVDPLDGTRYFARGEPEFAICVGFIVESQTFYGAIYDPIKSRLFWSQKGLGAFCKNKKLQAGKPGSELSIYCGELYKTIHGKERKSKPAKSKVEFHGKFSASGKIHKSLIGNFDLFKGDRASVNSIKFMKNLNITKVMEKGSALKFCDMAMGEVDIYIRFGPTSEWDTAAGQIILEEAGYLLHEMKTFQKMTYGKVNHLNSGVIACHKDLMPRVIQCLKEFDK